jgi:hypothetical protein
MPTPGNAGSNLTWLLQKQYEEVNINFRTVWDLYLRFYAVFLTFDIAAMALLLGSKPIFQPTAEIKHLIVVVFVLQSLLMAITSGFMALFTEGSRHHLEAARDALLRDEPKHTSEIPKISLPTAIAKYSAWGNCGAMLTMAVLWLILI